MSLRRFLSVMFASAVLVCAPSLLFAQGMAGAEKVDVFGGYSWYRAGGSIPSAVVDSTTIPGGTVPDFTEGWAGQLTYNLNHWAGIAVDAAGHYNDFGKAHSVAFGPQLRLRKGNFTPFGEALVGVQFFAPKQLSEQSAASFLAGGGLDYRVTSRFSIRPIQADYVNSYYDKLSPSGTTNAFHGVRLQAGLVVRFGFGAPAVEAVEPARATCVAQPEAVDAGTPVSLSVTPGNFSPKRTLSYSYESSGGKISGTGPMATVDTTGLNPGSYGLSATITDDGKGSHQQWATCHAGFRVNELPKHAPTLTVSAQPASVTAGDTSAIIASGSSADNRPLSYNCTATAGRLVGTGPSYTLETDGVPDSTVAVDCTVRDDRRLSASASASVKVNAANVAKVAVQAPLAKMYGSIGFQRDAKRPTRVDNEAKGELDRYADALLAAPDAKGVLVGFATPPEEKAVVGAHYAAQRAVNTKDYLSKEKGIDPARIEVRTSGGQDQKVELWIIPAGATFPQAGTTVVDEAAVKAVPRVALKKRKRAHRRVPPQEQ